MCIRDSLYSSRDIAEIPKGQLVDMLPEQLLTGQGRSKEELRSAVSGKLAGYELVVTMRPQPRTSTNDPWKVPLRPIKPLVLFRKRDIQSPPQLTAVQRGDFLEVRLGFDQSVDGAVQGLVQVFDADITLQLDNGTAVLLDPMGVRIPDGVGRRRSISGMVVDPRWKRPLTIARIPMSALASQDGEAAPISLGGRVYHYTMGPTSDSSDDRSTTGKSTPELLSPSAVAAAPLSYQLR